MLFIIAIKRNCFSSEYLVTLKSIWLLFCIRLELKSIFYSRELSFATACCKHGEHSIGLHNNVQSLIARFMGQTWDPSGADRTQVGPMLAPWTLLSWVRTETSCKYGPKMFDLLDVPVYMKSYTPNVISTYFNCKLCNRWLYHPRHSK